MNKMGIGIIGVNEGASILSAASQSQLCDLIQICDLNEELCKTRCEEFGVPSYTLQYEEMLANPQIDIIGIYTPDPLHAQHIAMALRAGKHVICTKPLFISLKGVCELETLQKETGKCVFVGQSTRFFESIAKQRKDYENGLLGELISMEANYTTDARWYASRDWSHGSGFSWMYGFMIHAVDLAAWYLEDVQEVYGMGYMSPNTKEISIMQPDSLKFLFKNSKGITAYVAGDYGARALHTEEEQVITCTLRGTKGTTRGGYPKLQYYTDVKEKEEPLTEFWYNKVEATTHRFDERWKYYFRFGDMRYHAGEYQNYLEYFIRSIQSGTTPKPDLAEGINTIAIMEAMRLSLEGNCPIRIQDVLAQYKS